jgi:hypothetical protein
MFVQNRIFGMKNFVFKTKSVTFFLLKTMFLTKITNSLFLKIMFLIIMFGRIMF